MTLSKLTIENFKCFKELTLALHPQMTILLGVNGTGKTSLLEALRVAIGSLYLGLDKYEDRIESPGIVNDDIRLLNLEQQFPTSVYAEADVTAVKASLLEDKQKIHWTRAVETRGGKTLYKDAKEMLTYSRALQQSIRDGEDVRLPLVAYFSTDRYKKERRDVKIELNGSRLRGYYNALDQTTNSKFFLNLYRTETLDQLQNETESELLKVVNEAVMSCVKCTSLQYLLKQDELFISFEDGSRIPFHLLSDGVRCTLAMVMEIAYRCYLLNPHLGTDAAKKTSGVVLVDEIDLHLHPSWQRTIIQDLRLAFPELQFVVTTHAPLVVGAANDCRIYSVSDGLAYDFPVLYGQDANSVLNVMGVDSMLDSNRRLLQDYMLMIEGGRGTSDEALSMRKQLEDILGSNHAELKRADMMLSFFIA